MEMLSTLSAEEHQQKLRTETGGLLAAGSWYSVINQSGTGSVKELWQAC